MILLVCFVFLLALLLLMEYVDCKNGSKFFLLYYMPSNLNLSFIATTKNFNEITVSECNRLVFNLFFIFQFT